MRAQDIKEPESELLIPEKCRPLFNKLFKYQKLTVNWILMNFLKKSKQFENFKEEDDMFLSDEDPFAIPDGLLIGHSPGLGKTPISCLTLKILFELRQIRFALIVLPKTVLNQWIQHIGQWCSGVPYCVYQGEKTKREDALNAFFRGDHGIVLSTYQIVSIDCNLLSTGAYKRAQFLEKRHKEEQVERSTNREQKKANLFANIVLQSDSEFSSDTNSLQNQLNFKQENNNQDDKDDFSEPSNVKYELPNEIQVKEEKLKIVEKTNDIIKEITEIFDDENFDITNQKVQSPFRHSAAFDFLILDEATEIKNHLSRVNISLSTIQCFFKICLTGTPIMNNMTEVYNIFEFLHPGFLGNRGYFNQSFKKFITASRLQDASLYDKLRGKKYQEELLKAISPIFYRKTKEQLKALDVNKQEIFIFMSMNNIQEQMYFAFLNSKKFRQELEQQFEDKMVPFQLITILRKICDNMMRINKGERYFLDNGQSHQLYNIQKQFFEMFRFANMKVDLKSIQVDDDNNEFVQVLQNNEVDESTTTSEVAQFQELNVYLSSKQTILNALINSFVQNKKKVLIFTEHTTTLNLIQLQLKQLNIQMLRIDGSITNGNERHRICEQFNKDSKITVFLMTIKVGGMGLNLQAAQRVLIFSPNWNPSVEEQAIGRAYRLGQTQDVIVYRFCVRNCIEERLVARQFHKQQVAEAMNQDGIKAMKVRQQDIAELFQRDIGNLQDSLLFQFDWMNDEKERSVLENIVKQYPELDVQYRFVNRFKQEDDPEELLEDPVKVDSELNYQEEYFINITTVKQLRAMGGNHIQNYSRWKEAKQNPAIFLNAVMKQVLEEKTMKNKGRHKGMDQEQLRQFRRVNGEREVDVVGSDESRSVDDSDASSAGIIEPSTSQNQSTPNIPVGPYVNVGQTTGSALNALPKKRFVAQEDDDISASLIQQESTELADSTTEEAELPEPAEAKPERPDGNHLFKTNESHHPQAFMSHLIDKPRKCDQSNFPSHKNQLQQMLELKRSQRDESIISPVQNPPKHKVAEEPIVDLGSGTEKTMDAESTEIIDIDD